MLSIILTVYSNFITSLYRQVEDLVALNKEQKTMEKTVSMFLYITYISLLEMWTNTCFGGISKLVLFPLSTRSCALTQLLGNQDDIKDMLEKMKNSYEEQQRKLEEKV